MARGKKTVPEEETAVKAVEEVVPEEKVQEKDEIAILRMQIEEMKHQLEEARKTQVIQVTQQKDEPVYFLFEAEVADDNISEFGDNGQYGRITGRTGSFAVPKSELSRVMDNMFRSMLERRWIIVVSGLTDEEREIYGVNYKEGEYLDKKAFAKMVDLGEEMLDIYPKLCDGHKEMVAKRYYEAYKAGNPNVTRDIVTKLNALSKESGSKKGDFIGIIELMNEADAS